MLSFAFFFSELSFFRLVKFGRNREFLVLFDPAKSTYRFIFLS